MNCFFRTSTFALVCAIQGLDPVWAQSNLGTPPPLNLDATDAYAAFHLQPEDTPLSPAGIAGRNIQVGQRAARLGLNSKSASDAWTTAQTLLLRPVADPTVSAVLFNGATASALNNLLSTTSVVFISVASASITIDEPIHLVRDGVTIDFGLTHLVSTNGQPYMIRVESAHNIAILGGIYASGNSAILISKSSNVLVDHAQISGLTGDGIVLTNSSHVMISNNRIYGLAGPGVIVSSGTSLSSVQQNDISNNTGASNWAAGIVLSDRDMDLVSNPQAILAVNGYGPLTAPITQRLNPSRDCLIAFNHISQNISSGIYVDGAVRMVIFANTLIANAKEGMCLDNGSTANVVASNVIQQNGKRWGQTDLVLHLDFVSGRLSDGTPSAKLPGISIDNAMYNVVFGNNVSHNFGDGIKMVRTGYFNVVGFNVVESDNDGANPYFRFFGISLGAAPADAPALDLDFTGSRGNVVYSNIIRGSNSSGIFIQLGSDQNQISDNVIKDSQIFAIEAVVWLSNAAQNNLTDAPSQNILPSCCSFLPRRPLPVRR